MDARALLQAVSETYANLKSLAVEIVCTVESGDEDSSSRTITRDKGWFVAPHKVRVEHGGARGMVTVTDGAAMHHYFGSQKRYSKFPAPDSKRLPGLFQPEIPIGSGSIFLFHQIGERIAEAEIVRAETSGSAYVLAVTYEPAPRMRLMVTSSPVLFWIDARTNLVQQLQAEVSHRRPAHDEVQTAKYTSEFTRVEVDAPILPSTFEYTPPADAIDMSDPLGRGGCFSMSGGGGGSGCGPDPARSYENWHGNEWSGDAFVERSRLKLEGQNLSFERRMTFSDDRKVMKIVERITGPAGTTEHEFSIPLE